MSLEAGRGLKAYGNYLKPWDLTEASRAANADICDRYGRDPLSFDCETLQVNNLYQFHNEGPHSHGYPYTFWMQLGLIYTCGIYTAQQQGIIRTGQVYKNFWAHHYFDWIQFAKRSTLVAGLGGLVLGSILFGN